MRKKNSNIREFKKLPGQFWNFIWKDDSLLSWIVSLVLAFIIVKFIFFPLLSLIFATSLPLVVVESGSMHHPGGFIGNSLGLNSNFEIWWQEKSPWYLENSINKTEAANWPLKTGLEIGDIVLVSGYGKFEIGDIIIFSADQEHPVIHRIINIQEIDGKTYYSTKGDNNPGQIANEKQIPEEDIIGKALFKVPKLGWIKLAFVRIFS